MAEPGANFTACDSSDDSAVARPGSVVCLPCSFAPHCQQKRPSAFAPQSEQNISRILAERVEVGSGLPTSASSPMIRFFRKSGTVGKLGHGHDADGKEGVTPCRWLKDLRHYDELLCDALPARPWKCLNAADIIRILRFAARAR